MALYLGESYPLARIAIVDEVLCLGDYATPADVGVDRMQKFVNA